MLINIDMLHNSHNNCVDNCDSPKNDQSSRETTDLSELR